MLTCVDKVNFIQAFLKKVLRKQNAGETSVIVESGTGDCAETFIRALKSQSQKLE